MAYVDIEKVLETARDGYHSDFGRSMADLTSLREVLEDTPTADVEEVKYGEWITDENGVVICSECGEEHEWQDFRPPYCDMCGSKNRD